MNGIAGIFHIETAKPVDPARLRAMLAADVWTGPGVGLAGQSAAADGPIGVVHSGAIANAAALRRELDLESHADVIAAAWRRWGPAMLPRLDGAFALALFDADRRSLFLARDRLGVKPLHHARLIDGSLAFASRLGSLIAHPLFRREPDPRAVDDFLALGYVPDDACLLSGVAKLPAGHSLLIERGRPIAAPSRWWDVDFERGAERSGEALLARLRQTIAPDAPGAILTGGVASAAIVALMAETSSRAIKTSAASPSQDDLAAAAVVARRFATDHRERTIELNDPAPILDEPFADPSMPLAHHRLALAAEAAPAVQSPAGMGAAFPDPRRYRRHAWRALLDRRADEAHVRTLVIAAEARSALYRPGLQRALEGHRPEQRFLDAMRAAPAADPFDRAHYADLTVALPAGLLARDEELAAALGIDLGLPFVDHRIVAFATGLPPRLRAGDGLLRRAMTRHLPKEILARPEPDHPAPVDGPFDLGPALAATGWFDPAAPVTDPALRWRLHLLDRTFARLFGRGQG